MQPKYKKIIDKDGLEGMAAYRSKKHQPKRFIFMSFYKSGYTLREGVLIHNDYL